MFDRPSPALETFEILFFAFISALVLYLLTIFYVTYVLLFNKQTFSWDGLVIERSIDTNATLI